MNYKTGLCSMCPPSRGTQSLVKGLCNVHYWQQKTQESISESLKNPEKQRRIIRLADWFTDQTNNTDWICENCKERVNISSYAIRISNHAHILPKRYFDSVMTEPENHLMLCGLYGKGRCHDEWDEGWETASQMPVLRVAIEKFTRFMHKIDPSEYKYLPDFFSSLLPQIPQTTF